MPEQREHRVKDLLPETNPDILDGKESVEETADPDKDGKKTPARSSRNLVPIIMSLALFLWLGHSTLEAQIGVDISLSTTYSDNVFQLSEYDLTRFDQEHPNLDYVNTTDDLTIAARVDLDYSFRYQWWKFTPSLSAIISQNISNPDKQRQDTLLRFRVDRYYWNFTALYGYYPRNLVRSYVDSDGTGTLEPYSYARNLFRGDLNIKALKATTIQLHARYEQLYYNQYWTEFDGNATTLGVGIRHSFPIFSVEGDYDFRTFDNVNADAEDSSYESNIYSGALSLKPMPLNENKPQGTTWYPSLSLSYEERYFQSTDDWYGGRADKIYNTDASLNFQIDPQWNLKLDYSHTFRNVDSPVAAVRRAREYGENKISAAVKYSF